MALFLRRGQPAEAAGRLALATVLQFMEELSARQAADAVRARIDWKYALGLELTDVSIRSGPTKNASLAASPLEARDASSTSAFVSM